MSQRFCSPFILESSGWRKYGDEEVILCAPGDAFDVEIDGHASIDALKKEILKRSPIKIQCDTKDLKLFLAKKGDAWPPYNDPAVLELKEGKIHEDIQTMIDGEEMDATQRLEDVLIANNMTKRKRRAPKSSQIHILVVVPEGRRRSAKKSHLTLVLERRRQLIRSTGRVVFEPMAEESSSGCCTSSMWSNIGTVLTKKKLCVLDVEKEPPLLSIKTLGRTGRDIEFSGSTDLLILKNTVKEDPSSLPFLFGVQMLIEVKKEVKVRSNFQALSELVALDLRTNDPVMALLTDLNDTWIFYWVAKKKNDLVVIHRAYIGNPSEGSRVIRTVLEKSSADIDAQIELPYFERPVKRLKLRPALSTVCGESGSIGESIQRYYDIASMLGPDEDMAREVAGQVVRSIPAFSYFS